MVFETIKMELRSYNVEKIYKECVKCRIQDDLGVDKVKLESYKEHIKDLLSQIDNMGNKSVLAFCNRRKDGEIWTPYLQIVEMLILLGKRIGCVTFDGKLNQYTLITFKNLNL